MTLARAIHSGERWADYLRQYEDDIKLDLLEIAEQGRQQGICLCVWDTGETTWFYTEDMEFVSKSVRCFVFPPLYWNCGTLYDTMFDSKGPVIGENDRWIGTDDDRVDEMVDEVFEAGVLQAEH